MPRLEEDGDRAERAIQAVLGHTAIEARAGEAAAHRPRRRSRRHRTGGPAPHTAIDLSLRGLDALTTAVGPEAAARLVGAVGSTVRAHVRPGDRLIDLGEGRLRLIVEADAPGAEAAADRIRGLTAAWLAASVVPVTLKAAIAPPAAAAAATDVAAS